MVLEEIEVKNFSSVCTITKESMESDKQVIKNYVLISMKLIFMHTNTTCLL